MIFLDGQQLEYASRILVVGVDRVAATVVATSNFDGSLAPLAATTALPTAARSPPLACKDAELRANVGAQGDVLRSQAGHHVGRQLLRSASCLADEIGPNVCAAERALARVARTGRLRSCRLARCLASPELLWSLLWPIARPMG